MAIYKKNGGIFDENSLDRGLSLLFFLMMMALNGDDVRFKYFFTKSPSDNGRSNPAIRICWMRGPTLILYLKI